MEPSSYGREDCPITGMFQEPTGQEDIEWPKLYSYSLSLPFIWDKQPNQNVCLWVTLLVIMFSIAKQPNQHVCYVEYQ